MAYDEYQAERIRNRLETYPNVVEKKMMGGLIFMVNGNMCVGIDKDKETGSDRLLVRVGKEQYESLLATKGSREMSFTGKMMRGFLFIDPDGFDQESDLDYWIDKAIAYNKTLASK